MKGIKKTVDELVSPDCPICHSIFASLKCSQCHPNAGMFWLDEFSSIRLCEDFCLALFDVCKDIPFDAKRYNPDGTSAHFYLNANQPTPEQFCAGRTAPRPNCYEAPIPTDRDANCKCPTHDCVDAKPIPPTQKKSNPNVIHLGEI